MTMRDHPPDDQLRRLAMGEGVDDETRAHVESCGRCREELLLLEAAAASAGSDERCLTSFELVQHADGRLPEARREQVVAHLRACEECALGLQVASDSGSGSGPWSAAWNRAVEALAALARVEPAPRLLPALRGRGAGLDLTAARAALEAEDMESAIDELERLADDAPVAVRLLLGRLLLEGGRPRRAVEHLRAAVNGAPKVAEPRWHLAQALLLEGRGEEALQQLERCAKAASDRREPARALARELRRILSEGP